MKSGKLITLTLAGISLALTGCRRGSSFAPHQSEIIPPADLPQEMRSSLPVYSADQVGALTNPPLNAYDPSLGYFHQSCNAWYPLPYGHYDTRWGYYRCGNWYRSHFTNRNYYPGYNGATDRNRLPVAPSSGESSDLADSTPTAGAPNHIGIPSTSAESVRSNLSSRGGFGSTGRRSSFFSGT